jgi:hypothetical protein
MQFSPLCCYVSSLQYKYSQELHVLKPPLNLCYSFHDQLSYPYKKTRNIKHALIFTFSGSALRKELGISAGAQLNSRYVRSKWSSLRLHD